MPSSASTYGTCSCGALLAVFYDGGNLTSDIRSYLVCLMGGSKCPVRADVARDIVDAILKSRALNKTPAVYWNKEEQEACLEAAFKKWDNKGVWTAAGAKVRPVSSVP